MHLRIHMTAVALVFVLSLSACGASETTDAGDSVYQTGSASRDGIGKFYMGREISHVMGHRGAMWLERPEREREERTDLLIQALPLEENSVVADVGAGDRRVRHVAEHGLAGHGPRRRAARLRLVDVHDGRAPGHLRDSRQAAGAGL